MVSNTLLSNTPIIWIPARISSEASVCHFFPSSSSSSTLSSSRHETLIPRGEKRRRRGEKRKGGDNGFLPPLHPPFPERAGTHLFAFPSNLFFSSPPFFVWTARAGNQVGPAEFIYFYEGRGNWRNRCESGGGGGRCSRWLMPTLPSCADVGGGFSLRLKSVIIAPKTAVYHHSQASGRVEGTRIHQCWCCFPSKCIVQNWPTKFHHFFNIWWISPRTSL